MKSTIALNKCMTEAIKRISVRDETTMYLIVEEAVRLYMEKFPEARIDAPKPEVQRGRPPVKERDTSWLEGIASTVEIV